MVLMDRGGLKIFPCRHISVVVDIELLHGVCIFVLEEKRNTLFPQRLAKVKKGGEGISIIFLLLSQDTS